MPQITLTLTDTEAANASRRETAATSEPTTTEATQEEA